ncbi:YhfC family intramembrane metalloprotease [Bacillus alveayuensis]|jgi:uncharacterized membrane protein YhfC|uniref:YhfC family intramembrane metalloprotease n=1 Tax=Aeribacillus alveayuensis TaxID=279215 RepID=UPI0005CD66E0|nr:YhfC family intramembrane metalloprotease [Bacillus alveayuensis]
MVSNFTMAGMVLQMLISLLFPIGLLIYLRKKQLFSWKPLGIGILIFILFSQILEKALHFVMVDASGPSLKWTDSVFLFVLYAVLAAGIFEELGRYFGFKWMLKNNREYKDGLSFGLGHGGIEAVLIGTLGAVNALILANLINSGAFDAMIASTLPAEQAAFLKEKVLNTGFAEYILGGIERIAAISFHMAMSLLVLLGIRESRFIFVIYAILLHAMMDVIPALYQAGVVTNIWIAEVVIVLFGIAAFRFTLKIKKRFQE